MDHRRLTTAQVIRAGILDMTAPMSRSPEDIQYHYLAADEEGVTVEYLRRSLMQVGALEASQYYGCWRIWKSTGGYDGELFQYHLTTEEFCSKSLDHAVRKAYIWYHGLD